MKCATHERPGPASDYGLIDEILHSDVRVSAYTCIGCVGNLRREFLAEVDGDRLQEPGPEGGPDQIGDPHGFQERPHSERFANTLGDSVDDTADLCVGRIRPARYEIQIATE